MEEGAAPAEMAHQLRGRDGGRHGQDELQAERQRGQVGIRRQHLAGEGRDGAEDRHAGIRQRLRDGEDENGPMLQGDSSHGARTVPEAGAARNYLRSNFSMARIETR